MVHILSCFSSDFSRIALAKLLQGDSVWYVRLGLMRPGFKPLFIYKTHRVTLDWSLCLNLSTSQLLTRSNWEEGGQEIYFSPWASWRKMGITIKLMFCLMFYDNHLLLGLQSPWFPSWWKLEKDYIDVGNKKKPQSRTEIKNTNDTKRKHYWS